MSSTESSSNLLVSKGVGFIGLGNIGKPMAANLIGKGFELQVYDVMDAPVAELAEQGAVAASKLADFSSCGLVSICVRDDKDVDALLYGESGLFSCLQSGAIIAIHSTVTRDNILRWHHDGEEKGIHLLDAPITGGAEGAANGTLCYMLGGDEVVVKQASQVFEVAAQKVLHAGPVGAGLVLKLANNLMTYSAFTAVSEAVALLDKNDVDASKLYEVGEANGVVTPQMHRFISNREVFAEQCSAEDMQAIFGPFALLAEKDLDHALALAKQSELPLPATSLVRQLISNVFLKN